MTDITLDILIPTMPHRSEFLKELTKEIKKQSVGYPVGIIIDDRDELISTGEKRNYLIKKSKAKYIWFVDDDDMIMEGAIAAMFEAFESNPDCLSVSGIMTTDGANPERFEMFKDCEAYDKVDGVYKRFTNHITPIKRTIAAQIQFQHITYHDDYKWAVALKESGLLKTEATVTTPVYHYKAVSNKKPYNMIIQEIERIIKEREFTFFIELGACDGYHTDILSRLAESVNGDKYRYHAFEPVGRLIQSIQNYTKERKHVSVYNLAVGSHCGVVPFWESTNPDYYGSSSIRKPTGALGHWDLQPKQVSIPCTTLDEHLLSQGLENEIIDFVWADVQGAEVDVINGGVNAFKHVRYFYTEYCGGLYEGDIGLEDICKLLPDFEIAIDYGGDVLLKNKLL